MKSSIFVKHLVTFFLLIQWIFSVNTDALENMHQDIFKIPTMLPHTQYSIEVTVNPSSNLLVGLEVIQIQNPSFPLKRLVIDWKEEIKIFIQNEPIQFLAKGKNCLSNSQILIELPQAIKKGESTTLEIQFSFPFKLEKINKLEEWYPRLWWGRDTLDDYEVKVNAPDKNLIAASGVFDKVKYCYTAKGCRIFGIVFMKDLKVLKAVSGDTDIYSYFDEDSRKCVEFTHQTAIDVIDFYRKWLGFYPHKILHIIPGGLSHPAGGYPVATAIVGIHGQKQMDKKPKSHWQFITAHEIGHQYWMEHVMEAPNTFWLMIGLGIYADRAFMLAKGYGDQHERDMFQPYINGTRDQLDTRMNRLPVEMEKVDFDYNNIVNHKKGFSVISALACMMGKDTFDSAYQWCLKEFKGRTLGVADFQRVCEEESGDTLDWFFDQWIRTSRFLSYEIASHKTSSNNGIYTTTAKVRKSGTLRMPVPVTALFEDNSHQCLYTDRLLDECILVFTGKAPLKEIKLDINGELPLVVPPPNPRTDQLKKDINSLDVVGEGDKALQIFKKTQNVNMEDADLFFRLGMALFDGNHYEESLQAFQKCAELDSKNKSMMYFLGLVWQGHLLDLLNRRDEAVTFYKQALQHCDADTDIRHDQYGMRITHSWVENRIQSPFKRLEPKMVNMKNQIDKLEYTGEGNKALQLFNEAKTIKLDDSNFSWGKLGLCLYDGKHYTEALQSFKNDINENPTSYNSLVWQGHLLDLMNNREEAIKCYKQALEHWDPDFWVRHDQYKIKVDRNWIEERLKTPFRRSDSKTVNQADQSDQTSEPQLDDILKNMGCDDSAIKNPLSVSLFKAVAKPSVKILQKNGNADVSLGWYQNSEEHLLFENFTGSTSPKTFDPGKASIGFFIHVDFQCNKYRWYTDISKNNSESHVKVYPLVKEGKDIPDSYLLCWEDLPIGSEENADYQDIIVQISGVTPVASQAIGSDSDNFPRFSFHIWGRVPFPNSLTDKPQNQRILFSIRKNPKRSEEIAQEVKFSKEEVSNALSNLAKHDLIKVTNGEKWVTNFPISTKEEIVKAHKIGMKYARVEADILRKHIPKIKETYEQCQVSKYHPWSETSLIIVGAQCADFCVSDRIRFKPQYFDEKFLPPLHPDGRRWGYSGEEVLTNPLPFRKYQFYQNVFENPEGGITRFGYYSLLDEKRVSPPSRPENLRYNPEGKIWLSLTTPLTIQEIQRRTGLSLDVVQSTIDKMSRWNPPGSMKEDDKYISSIPILSLDDLNLLLPETDRLAEIIFNQVTIPMEKELEEEGKQLGLRFPLSSGTSARDIAIQILSEESSISPIAQPPVPWNFGVWGWNGHLKMWEDVQ